MIDYLLIVENRSAESGEEQREKEKEGERFQAGSVLRVEPVSRLRLTTARSQPEPKPRGGRFASQAPRTPLGYMF